MTRSFVCCVLLTLCAFRISAEERTMRELLGSAKQAFQSGRVDEAIALASLAIESNPEETAPLFSRATIYDVQGRFVEALADWDRLIKMKPRAASAYQMRGCTHFKLGQINESIADFDKYIEQQPDREPYHWQRGIAYYYAGRYSDGRKQFELHQTVNPSDVENAVWHFLCYAREKDVDAARTHLIPITGDARVPMPEVHKLFASDGTADEVLRAAETGQPSEAQLNEQRFYAHLYLGLYYEAMGDDAQAREHVLLAADKYSSKHYMGDVARVHADRLRRSITDKRVN